MNFADNSIEESVLIFPLSQDLHNAMLRIQSRVQKLKETEVLLLKTYKSFVNNDDKDEVTKLTQQLKEMTSEIGYLSDQIESNSLERIRLEKKSNECKECPKNVQKLRDFKGEIEEIKNELIKADQLLISSRKEKTELQAAYEDIRKQYEELKDFDPKEYEAAFADMNSEKEQLTASNDELTRTISSQEAIIWKIDRELLKAKEMIDERDKMLITAKNMIAKLRDSQADTEEKLIHYKQRSSQKTAKDSSYTDIQSHEEMLRGEIYSLHEKLDMLSRAADDELKSKSETIEKLTQENQSINRSFGDLEMKLRDIESESKARDEKYMEIVNEKEFEISSLMKETQEQMQLKDLEISQMKKSLNTIANINFDSDRTHYTSQKQGHKSTPNKRKSPIKTYSKAATEMVNRPDPKLECEESQDLEITVHDLDQESQLPLIDFWKDQAHESTLKEAILRKQILKLSDQEAHFFNERVKALNEIGSSKQLLHERLKLKDEDVESKINDLLAQQHLFVDIIRELESLLVKKNHLLGNQYDIHVRQVSDLKGLIDVYRSELKYRDDLLSITLCKPILSGLRNNDINEENKSLRYDCEDLKTRLSYQIEENGILKSRIGELQAICDSINTEFQEMPKISLFSDEKPYKLEEKIRDLKNEYLKVTQSSHADHKSIKELQDSLKETEIYYEKLLEDKANVNSQLLTTVKSLKDELNSKKIELSPISRQSDIEKSRLTITPLRLTNRSRHGSLDFDAQPFTLREGSGNQLYEKDLKYSQSKTHRRKHSHHHKGKIELSEVLNIVEHIKDEIVGKSFPKKDLTVEAREVFISFSNWHRSNLNRSSSLNFLSDIISMLISSPKLKEQIYRIKQLKGNIDNYDLSVIYKEVLGYIDYLCESTDSTELNPKVITKLEELYMRLKSSAESVSKVAHRLQEMKWSLANEECRTDIFLRVLEMVGNFFDNYIMEHKIDEENLLRAIKYLSSAVCKYK